MFYEDFCDRRLCARIFLDSITPGVHHAALRHDLTIYQARLNT
jgi:hypothetical protein